MPPDTSNEYGPPMHAVSISGTGVFTPEETISNAELVAAFNAYADRQNALHADEIAAGEREPVPQSNEGFIVKASGIESRYVLDKKGTLDPEIMHPVLRERSDEELSVMAEMALKAATVALEKAGRTAADIGLVGAIGGKAHQMAVHHHGADQGPVRQVVAAGLVGIVEQVNIALAVNIFAVVLAVRIKP